MKKIDIIGDGSLEVSVKSQEEPKPDVIQVQLEPAQEII